MLHAVSFLEPLDTSSSVNQFLLASEERVAGRAYLGGDLRPCRTGLERIAALAFDRYFRILGMNTLFHIFFLLSGESPPQV